MKRKTTIYFLSAVYAFCALVGCNSPSIDETSEKTSLPAMTGMANAEVPPAPSACTWATTVDAIVWARIDDIRLVDDPLIKPTGSSWEWVDECSGSINTAMELDITIERELLEGALDTEHITVHIGNRQKALFQPTAVVDDGEIRWLGDEDDALQSGQQIGMALHWVPEHDAWSLMGEALFGHDGDGSIVFQRRGGESVEPAPSMGDTSSVEDLAKELARCAPTSETADRQDYIEKHWGPGDEKHWPTRYIAAECIPSR